ncbi:MAG: hypothetical protein RIM80_12355, partial [Alphaproteobacteria bacterium]
MRLSFHAKSARHAAVLGLAMFAVAALPETARAVIVQEVGVSFDPTPDQVANGDGALQIRGVTDLNGPITDAITASIVGNGFSAVGSVGPFGDLGMEGRASVVGQMRAQVDIESNDFVNLFATPREARLNFIIDGGEFNFIAGAGSDLRMALTIAMDRDTVFQTGFRLTTGADIVNPEFDLIGQDIGFIRPRSTSVEIPFAFGSVSLGLIQPNQRFSVSYQASIIANIEGFAEVVNFAFS